LTGKPARTPRTMMSSAAGSASMNFLMRRVRMRASTRFGMPTLMVRIANGRRGVLADAAAKLNVLLSETSAEGKLFHRA